jgi:hypothetical protein
VLPSSSCALLLIVKVHDLNFSEATSAMKAVRHERDRAFARSRAGIEVRLTGLCALFEVEQDPPVFVLYDIQYAIFRITRRRAVEPPDHFDYQHIVDPARFNPHRQLSCV